MPYKMLNLLNLDELFSQNPTAVVANNISFADDNFSESITKLVYSENDTDDIGFVAKCQCGHLHDNYTLGTICPLCHTTSSHNFVEDLQHKVWIGAPPGIIGFLHPIVYFTLSKWLSRGKGKGSYLDDLLDPKGVLPADIADQFDGRGFNYVHDNFEFIITFFLALYPKTKKKKQAQYIRLFLDTYKDSIFCTKLPILSNELHPITKEGKSLKYTDDSSQDILEAIIDLATVQFAASTTVVSKRKLELVAYSAYNAYIEYLTKIVKKKLAGKPAILRHHIFGTRLHATFRSVIVPIMGEHQGDELHLPWVIGVSAYKLMIINVLMNKKHYSLVEALAAVSMALIKYDPEIHQILNQLIKECGYREYDAVNKKYKWIDLPGLPVLFNRNPSLRIGSIQLLFVTKIKPIIRPRVTMGTIGPALTITAPKVDIQDQTIAMSTLILKDCNADFDGDALAGACLFEMGEIAKFMAFHPSKRMLSNSVPEVSASISLAKQEVLMLNGFLDEDDEDEIVADRCYT